MKGACRSLLTAQGDSNRPGPATISADGPTDNAARQRRCQTASARQDAILVPVVPVLVCGSARGHGADWSCLLVLAAGAKIGGEVAG